MLETTIRSTTDAVAFLKQVSQEVPEAAVVLGSGVKVLEDISEQTHYSYEQIFGISPSIAGHAGSLSLGRIDGHLIAVLRGRFHLYEGHDWSVVTLPTRVLVEWGVPNLYLTNAAGGFNPSFRVGDLMLLTGYRNHLHPQWQESGLLPALMSPICNAENELTSRLWSVGEILAKDDLAFRPLKRGV